MGSETCNPTSSPGGKRSRDPEDEVYIDNLHSHKRYLSEIMASSLNGLTVGDSLPDNLMESPARSDGIFYPRDDMCLQYSPMSEDSDESRSYETSSVPTSPVSPYRSSRPLSSFSSTPPATSSTGCVLAGTTSSQSRQRGSDSEGRFPSSPSDICHSADLRRAALLRSVQMRTQPAGPSAFELPGHLGQGSATANVEAEEPLPCNLGEGSVAEIVEAEEPHCHYMKSLVVDGECPMEDCSGMGVSADEFNHGKS